MRRAWTRPGRLHGRANTAHACLRAMLSATQCDLHAEPRATSECRPARPGMRCPGDIRGHASVAFVMHEAALSQRCTTASKLTRPCSVILRSAYFGSTAAFIRGESCWSWSCQSTGPKTQYVCRQSTPLTPHTAPKEDLQGHTHWRVSTGPLTPSDCWVHRVQQRCTGGCKPVEYRRCLPIQVEISQMLCTTPS